MISPVLLDILKSDWLLYNERPEVYASVLLSLLKGEPISGEKDDDDDEGDRSTLRAKSRSYVIPTIKGGLRAGPDQRLGLHSDQIPEGSTAVIPIRGEIFKYDQECGPRGTMSIINDIRTADMNPKISSVVLVIDSPGGQVQHTDLLADTIMESETPVVAYVEGIAASAAYWIACSAQKIIASSDLDRIGSIGTMASVVDLQPYYEEMGVKFHEIYASKSKDKNKDYRDILEGKYDGYRKATLDRINEKFHTGVKANRPGVDESVLTGKVYFAPEAIELGLIDEINTFDYAVDLSISLATKTVEPTNSEKDMKITFKSTWTALIAALGFKAEEASEKELTEDMITQVNDKLADLTTKNADLEKQFQDERAAKLQLEEDLKTANKERDEAKKELDDLKAKDAGAETVAGKKTDKIEQKTTEDEFAHNKEADAYLG